MAEKNVTFADIAKYTNFSKTTISRYFSNPDSLTAENQEKIRKALIKLNYKENKVARILAKGQTEFVGILIPNLRNSFYSEMLRQILMSYNTYGYKFLVFNGDQQENKERQYLDELMAYKIEGLLVLSHTLPSRELADLNIPVVSIEREDEFISSVNCDNYTGALQATGLLASCNCEIFIHINTVREESVPSYQRIVGFREFCSAHHLPCETYIYGDVDTASERRSLAGILDLIENRYPEKKKGIFFSNDTAANEFLNLLIRRRKTMPPDYKIVGFDGAPVSESAVYPISTIDQQIGLIADEAMKLLISQIDEKKKRKPEFTEPVHRIITPVLVRRETTTLD